MNILQETYHIVETIKMTDTKEKQKWFYLLRSECIDSYRFIFYLTAVSFVHF